MNARTENALLLAALGYAARGWRVLPIWHAIEGRCGCGEESCDRPAKHPIGRLAPSGVDDATTDESRMRFWFTAYPNANVGIATGRESNLTVVDADARGGKPGAVNLTRLCAAHGGV